MFSIEYEDWKNICSQIFYQRSGRKKIYLQWYPFTKLSIKDRKEILSEEFFEQYIKTGLFLYYQENWVVANNYMMKGDGNFRNASLISPLMYLLALTIGKTISKKYFSKRSLDINVFYAGNFNENRLYYSKDYDLFYKLLNEASEDYQYFIKTDIKDFFSNIDLNKLFEMINTNLLYFEEEISQKDLILYKELFSCLGQGEFPLIENNTSSSFLSTVVYLEEADINLYSYIKEKEAGIINFKMARYVDDLYILFNSQVPEEKITPIVNRILNCYSSELKKINLSLNRDKTRWRRNIELSEELKKSLYDEYIHGKDFRITDMVDSKILIKFLGEIKLDLYSYRLDLKKYAELLEKYFYLPGVEYTPQEIYNSLIYENHSLFLDKTVINILQELIEFDYSFMKLDTKRLVVMLLKTKNSMLIKKMLCKLFEANRNGTWNIYDTSLAINYLVQRNFEHTDLLKILKKEEPLVYQYYETFCKSALSKSIEKSKQAYIEKFKEKYFSKTDDKLFFLYFMYMVEYKKNNHLSAFAYYKNFFDRISAHLGKTVNNDSRKGKPNYKAYYKEGVLKGLYSNIANSNSTIEEAHRIRNSNPLSHSSAELIDSDKSHIDIMNSIYNLEFLLASKIEEL